MSEPYTESDVGSEVFIVHEGVGYYDVIVRVNLPDGQVIIGPRLTCGHLFARFTMLQPMLDFSNQVDDAIEGGEVNA